MSMLNSVKRIRCNIQRMPCKIVAFEGTAVCGAACSDLKALVDVSGIVDMHGGVKRIMTHHAAHF